MTPTGVGRISVYRLIRAIKRLLEDYFYEGMPIPEKPISERHLSKTQRNNQIIAQHQQGHTLEQIAAMFDISIARVHQIIVRWSEA